MFALIKGCQGLHCCCCFVVLLCGLFMLVTCDVIIFW